MVLHITSLLNLIRFMKLDVILRIIGSILVITAYFVILHIDVTIGVIINLIADIISVPYFIKTKSWDVVVMLSFISTIGISKLLT